MSILGGFYGFYVDFARSLWILARFYWVFMDAILILLGFYGFYVDDFAWFLWILC